MNENKNHNLQSSEFSKTESLFIQETPKKRKSLFFYITLFIAIAVVSILLYRSFASVPGGTKTFSAINTIGQDFDGTSDGTYNLTITGGGGNTRHWDGSDSADWHTAANWAENLVPEACSMVIIDGDVEAFAAILPIPLDYYDPILDLSGGSEGIASLYVGTQYDSDPDSTPTTLTVSYGSDTNKLTTTGDVVIGDTDNSDINGSLTHTANDAVQEYRLNLEVGGNLLIDVGGMIDLQGKGYDNLNGPGTEPITVAIPRFAAHGGYGGFCNTEDCYHDNYASTSYGSITEPFEIGSGGEVGRIGFHYRQAAGGAVKVIADGNITINGNILANTTTKDGGSGASGGSVWLDGDTVSGSAKILAESGDSINYPTPTSIYPIYGGGGRIAIYYNTLTLSEDNIATQHKNAWGGAGTIYLKDKAETYGDLIVDNNTTTTVLLSGGNIYERAMTPQFTSLMDPANKEMTYRSIRISDYAKYEVSAGATLNILDTTALSGTITEELWNNGTVNFKAASGGAPLNTYTLLDTFTFVHNVKDGTLSGLTTDLTVDNSGFATSYTGETSDENIFNMGNITVQNGGILTHPRNYVDAKHTLSLNLSGDLTIDATSKIDLEGRGHTAGGGLGYAGATGGAAHGGYGYYSSGQGQVYGSITNPLYLGSGGAFGNYSASAWGGGAVNITANNMTLDGDVVSIQRDNDRFGSSNGGSGGSILLNVNNLSGSGDIASSGGPCGWTTFTKYGGGGGRIALYFNDNSGFTGDISTASIAGTYSDKCGGAGTIYLKDKDDTSDNGTLIVDNTGFDDAESTPQYADLMDISNQEMTYSHIEIGGNAEYVIESNNILNILSSTTNSGDKTGYLTNYGTVNFPADYELSDTFTFNQDAKNATITGLNTELRVNNSGLVTFNTTSDSGTLSGESLTIPGNLIVTNTSFLTHAQNTTTQEHTLNLEIGGNFSLDNTSEIDVDGLGYQYGYGPGSGYRSNYIGAASYGGRGSLQYDDNEPYGSITEPLDLGSGGCYLGGYGGGAIKIMANGDVTIDGNVSATHGSSTVNDAGSGGSIFLEGNKFQGIGSLNISGLCGTSFSSTKRYSGGGRMALKFADDTNLFSGNIIAAKSSGTYCAGAGTVYFENKTTGWDKLLIDRNGALDTGGFDTSPQHTDLMDSSFQNMTYTEIEIRNGGKYEIGSDDTLNLPTVSNLFGDRTGDLVNDGTVVFAEINPILTSLFSIYNNTGILQGATDLTLNDTDLYHTASASLDVLTDLTMENGATVELQDYNLTTPLELDSITINNGGVLTHPNNTDTQAHVLNLLVDDLIINTGGEINVQEKGYAIAYGPGAGTSESGGGYGGAGGAGTSGVGGISYGSETNPVDLGSGAGTVGIGGGLVKAQINNLLIIDGNISADGTKGAYHGGGGAGGTVLFTTNQFQGIGMITADGGSALTTLNGCEEYDPGCTPSTATSYGGGGGGGRIAIYYQDTNIAGNHFLLPGNGSVTKNDSDPITMINNDPFGGQSGTRTGTFDGDLGTLYLAFPDHYKITGNSTQVAGTSQNINVTLTDNNGNPFIITDNKNFTFSGANQSPNGTDPTIEDKNSNPIIIGNTTPLSLVNGTVFTDMILYKTEIAEIETTDGFFNTFADQSYDLDVTVTEAAPDQNQTTIDTLVNPLPAGNTVDIVVTPKDLFGNPITATGAIVALNIAGVNPIGALATVEVVDGITGLVTYIADYLASNVGVDNITGTINTNTITDDEDGTSDGTYHQLITGGGAGHLEITIGGNNGAITPVPIVAGSLQTITIEAKDSSGSIDLAYTGLKNITITGTNNAPNGTKPTTRDNGGVDVSMTETPSFVTSLNFINGVATSQMYLYKQEIAEIEATDGTISTFGNSDYDLNVDVTNSGIDYIQSLLEVNKAVVEPNEEVTITVITRDQYQNPLTVGGETVTASISGSNPVGSISLTDNSDGTYSTTSIPLTHHVPTNLGNDQITAIVSGNAVTHDNDGTDDGTFNLLITTLPKHIEITGSSTQVAGTSQVITLTVKNSIGSVDTTYNGNKPITFSGASISSKGDNPTVDSINFSSVTTLNFVGGVATANMTLFTVEIAEIEATDGTISTFADPSYDLDVTVTESNACLGVLNANPNPVQVNNQVGITLNNVTDQYGNPITVGGSSLNLSITGVNPTSLIVIDNGNGTYSSDYTPSNAGIDNLDGTLGVCSLNTVSIDVLSTEVPICGNAAKEYPYDGIDFVGSFCQVGTPNPSKPVFPNMGDTTLWDCEKNGKTANCVSSRKQVGDSREVDLYNIKNINCTSLDLRAELKGFPNDNKFDFKVYVKDLDTGKKFKLKLNSVKVSNNKKVTLHIDSINESANYEFKVAASEENDSNYTDSNKDGAKTLYCNNVTDTAVCGNNAKTYSNKETNFAGDFCQKGSVGSVPSFPKKDSSVSWVCNYQSSSVNCSANRKENIIITGNPICGDSKKEGNEECDDGNAKNGDGCNSSCKIEVGGGIIIGNNPVCGSAAQVYQYTDSSFVGDFCQLGTLIKKPNFPDSGDSSSWTCEKDGKHISCNSSRLDDKIEKIDKKDDDFKFPVWPWLSALGLFATGLLLIPFRTAPILNLMELFGLVTKRSKDISWGTVFEEETKMPVVAVKVTLMDTLGRELETVYSDKHGRFGFLAGAGTYLMDIYKADYSLKIDKNKDPIYGDLYVNKPFTIEEDKVIVKNIAMKSNKIDWKEYADKRIKSYTSKFRTFKEYFLTFIHIVCFIYTAIITFLFPNNWNIAMMIAYVVIFIIQLIVKKRNYGTITTADKKPVPFSVVSIYNKITKNKEAFAVSNVVGRYYLLAENGDYDITVKGQPTNGNPFEKRGDIRVTKGLIKKNIRV